MDYIKGTPREQLHLFTENLDEIIDEENPVRFIEAYINKLDMGKLGFKVPDVLTGRPPYAPVLLLKIYIYSYLNKVRSSRRIETACQRNIELIWLTEQLAPDFKTIADFRKDNKEGIKNIFKEFLKLCHKLELLSFKCVAIDGTKMRAQNGMNNVYKKEEIEKIEKALEEKINKYIVELEENDEKEKDDFEFLSKNIGEKIKNLKKRKEKINIIKQIFEQNPDVKIYFSEDTDSRMQRDKGRVSPGYNCQTVVDEQNKLIIANDVTNQHNDYHQLNNMRDKTNESKKELKINQDMLVTADAGYYCEAEITEIIESDNNDNTNNLDNLYIPHPRDVKLREKQGKDIKDKIPAKGYEKSDFKYDEVTDKFICPEGKVLKRVGAKGSNRRGTRIYKYLCRDCTNCKAKHLCTKRAAGRRLEAPALIKELERFRKRTNSEFGKSITKKRKELAEHPFGTIKRNWGYLHFMQKGEKKVKSEFSFIAFIYNLKRVLNIVPMNELIQAVS